MALFCKLYVILFRYLLLDPSSLIGNNLFNNYKKNDIMEQSKFPGWHGTTIIGVKKGNDVVIAGDGQVSLGNTVIKGSAKKVRRISPGGHDVICGFAGSTADAFTLLERLEAKLEASPGQ